MVTLSDQKKSILYDQLKIITIFLVILGHCLIMFSAGGAIVVQQKSALLAYASTILYRFHIPCFFMVSGAIFALNLQKGKYAVFSAFALKKAMRLLVPYLIFGVFAVLPTLMICGLLEPSRWYTFLGNLFFGRDVRHLWYLYALFAVFLIFWCFRRRLMEGDIRKVLVLSFVVSFICRSFPLSFSSYFQISNIGYYQFFFVWGIFFHRYFDEILCYFRSHWYWLIVGGLLLLLSCFADLYTLSGYVYAAAGVMLSVALGWLFSRREGLQQNKWWRFLIRDSYGMYLFHPMIVYLIFYGFSHRAVPPVLLMLLAFVVSTASSFILTELCRKGHFGFVIGEGRIRVGEGKGSRKK